MYIICSLEPIVKVYNEIVRDDYPFIKNDSEKENIAKDISCLEKIIQSNNIHGDMISKEELSALSPDTMLDIAIELYLGDAVDYSTYNRMISFALSRF